MRSRTYIVLHGHFYQPPRENPWTYEIERQPSAHPYHDWNERINEECFSANSDSRLLDGYGHIRNIINNYEYLSFNVGPTLFRWLEKKDPDTYQKIIDADKKSIERNNGHGNAIAMAFNHPILPLCNEYDLETQIRWGLEEFKYRYGRESESMWLPETAVNMRVVEKLLEFNIKYIILAPSQADKVRLEGTTDWIDVSGNNIDISRPYYIQTSKGQMGVFFYHGEISASVSFEHLLINADKFKSRLLGAVNYSRPNPILSIATDGEIYGHHEPFGNMCVSAFVEDTQNEDHIVVTNYGNYLEMFPPKDEVILKPGKYGLGTAWSCSHGVGRWMENCGCKTGGDPEWTQEWRRPFREALDYLRDKLCDVYEKEASKYVDDPWEARNDYIKYILDRKRETLDNFLKKHFIAKDWGDSDVTDIVRLLESQKYSMYMYTSCAWFFSEISGIETVQNMKYAKKAIEYVEDYIDPDAEKYFKRILRNAKSNIVHHQDGEWIYDNFVSSSRLSEEQIVSQFLFYKMLVGNKINKMYQYEFEIEQEETEGMIYSGIIKIFNTIDQSKGKFIFYIMRNKEVNMYSYMRKFHDDELKEYIDRITHNNNIDDIRKRFKDWFLRYFTLRDVDIDYRESILNEFFHDRLVSIENNKTEIEIEDLLKIMSYYAEFGVNMPPFAKLIAKNRINSEILKECLILKDSIDKVNYHILERILKIADMLNIQPNYEVIESVFNKVLSGLIDSLDENNIAFGKLEKLIKIIDFANKTNIRFKRKKAENKLFKIVRGDIIRDFINIDKKHSKNEIKLIKLVVELASKINVSTYEIRKALSKKGLSNII